jgi:hypothetical protein
MKAEDIEAIEAGDFDIQDFHLHLSASGHPDYFYSFLTYRGHNLTYYVNLVEDERFGKFAGVGNYSRIISEHERVEYNHYVGIIFHKIMQPALLLERHSVARVMDICLKIKKKR